MTPEILQDVVRLFVPLFPDVDTRRTLTLLALGSDTEPKQHLLATIEWQGNADAFSLRLVQQLVNYGDIEPGQTALQALFDMAISRVGYNKQQEFISLYERMATSTSTRASTPVRDVKSNPPLDTSLDTLKIFISYSRKNSNVAHSLADSLRSKGFIVWTDITGIPGGAAWHATLEDALNKCHVLLVLWSEASRASEWVQKEILYALNLQKVVIPILIDRTPLSLALIDLQPVDGSRGVEKTLAPLMTALPKHNVSIITPAQQDPPETQHNSLTAETLQGLTLLGFRRRLFGSQA